MAPIRAFFDFTKMAKMNLDDVLTLKLVFIESSRQFIVFDN